MGFLQKKESIPLGNSNICEPNNPLIETDKVVVDDRNLLQNQSEQLETNPSLDGVSNADDALNNPRNLNLSSFDNSSQTVHK
jgi:hypothetical protein